MDKFLVPGGSGIIELSASAQARTEKDARRLNIEGDLSQSQQGQLPLYEARTAPTRD